MNRLTWTACSAVVFFGLSMAAQAGVLSTPYLNTSGSTQYAACLAVNVSAKPHDIKVEILNADYGTVQQTATCTAVAPQQDCFIFDSSTDVLWCRITVKGLKGTVRGDLMVRDSTTNSITSVVPAQ